LHNATDAASYVPVHNKNAEICGLNNTNYQRQDKLLNYTDTETDWCKPITATKGSSAVKLNKYNGQSSLTTWLSQFNITATCNNWVAQTKFVQLVNHLTDVTADAVLYGGMEDLDTFDKVVSALKYRFGTDGQTDKFREELRSRKQTTNETLSRFMPTYSN
jgi:hypothetical protein